VGYAPRQNGAAAERAIGVLCNVALSIHKDAVLSAQRWGASMEHIAWILNRLPAAGAGVYTPYERMFGVKPAVSQLKICGSPA
jgi:hypothetical protein